MFRDANVNEDRILHEMENINGDEKYFRWWRKRMISTLRSIFT
jgi:hypothetical protein